MAFFVKDQEGATNPELAFTKRLLEIAGDLTYLLEGLDEYSMKVHFRNILQASISYTL